MSGLPESGYSGCWPGRGWCRSQYTVPTQQPPRIAGPCRPYSRLLSPGNRYCRDPLHSLLGLEDRHRAGAVSEAGAGGGRGGEAAARGGGEGRSSELIDDQKQPNEKFADKDGDARGKDSGPTQEQKNSNENANKEQETAVATG